MHQKYHIYDSNIIRINVWYGTWENAFETILWGALFVSSSAYLVSSRLVLSWDRFAVDKTMIVLCVNSTIQYEARIETKIVCLFVCASVSVFKRTRVMYKFVLAPLTLPAKRVALTWCNHHICICRYKITRTVCVLVLAVFFVRVCVCFRVRRTSRGRSPLACH